MARVREVKSEDEFLRFLYGAAYLPRRNRERQNEVVVIGAVVGNGTNSAESGYIFTAEFDERISPSGIVSMKVRWREMYQHEDGRHNPDEEIATRLRYLGRLFGERYSSIPYRIEGRRLIVDSFAKSIGLPLPSMK